MPYCSFTKTENGTLIARGFSAEIELLKILAASFNFSYNFIDEKQSWGLLENGTWTGTVGSVFYGVWLLQFLF